MEKFLGISKDNWKLIFRLLALLVIAFAGAMTIVYIGNSSVKYRLLPCIYNGVLYGYILYKLYKKWWPKGY